jgi:beta-lactamase superfamily II metal-dependent hydrolase
MLVLAALVFACGLTLAVAWEQLAAPTTPALAQADTQRFIDVGQGDGVLVQAGGESYLIDAGRPEEGPNVVDFLRSRGVDSLDGIVVSNPDADHIGGFLDVFEVETVYVSGDPNNTLTYNTFLRGVRDEGATTEILRAGMLMDWSGVRADT